VAPGMDAEHDHAHHRHGRTAPTIQGKAPGGDQGNKQDRCRQKEQRRTSTVVATETRRAIAMWRNRRVSLPGGGPPNRRPAEVTADASIIELACRRMGPESLRRSYLTGSSLVARFSLPPSALRGGFSCARLDSVRRSPRKRSPR